MKLLVDADACPRPVKEIVFRAARRKEISTTLVANQPLHVPRSPYIHTVVAPGGFNEADDKIVTLTDTGDVVVTADIPLAGRVIKQGAVALTPRGKLYTAENIGEVLSMRNVMDELRSSGMETGGPSAFSSKDREHFANRLDQLLNAP